MTEYAKILENGNLEYAPRDIPGVSNWGLNEANVLAAGYLPVDSVVAPKGKQQAGWKIENDRIVPDFVDIPPMPEPTYIELRQAAYPPVGDQLDMIYWDQVNGTNLWRKTIAAVKSKYPKPVENQTGEAAAANDGTDETVSSATDASEQDILSWTGA